jgi:hypothetical protein
MGKASSSKKVARAAGLGGSRNFAARPAWTYYFAVFLLVVLGCLGVYNSREYLDGKVNANGSGQPPSVNMATPWFEGYAVDECGKLLPPVKASTNTDGIYTKGNGIIWVNPKNKASAGKNATLAKFASSVGMTLNAGELQVPGSRLYTNDDTCEGKQGHVYVMTWSNPSAPPQDGVLQDKDQYSQATGMEDTCSPDCDSGVLLENDQLLTIAFLPAAPSHHTLSVLQPPPSVVAKLTNLISTGGTTTTTAAPVPSSTTTVPSKTSSTTAPSKGGTTPTDTTTSVATTPTTKAPAKTAKAPAKTAKAPAKKAKAKK